MVKWPITAQHAYMFAAICKTWDVLNYFSFDRLLINIFLNATKKSYYENVYYLIAFPPSKRLLLAYNYFSVGGYGENFYTQGR